MAEGGRQVEIRSFGGVTDRVERRLFRIDRWRIPTPHGVSVRAVLYTGACFFAVVVLSQLPIAAQLLSILPASVKWALVPVAAGAALAAWQIDGRPPHWALFSVVRQVLRPNAYAGLRPCPRLGTRIAPVGEVRIAPSGDEARYRPGRVRGPATVFLGYPARLRLEKVGVGASRSGDVRERLSKAQRIRIEGPAREARPLAAATRIDVPARREVVFE